MTSKARKMAQVPLGFVEPQKHEYYFTPREVTRAAIECLRTPPRAFLDAGSGTGEIAWVCQNRFPKAYAYGVEIDPKRFEASKWPVQWTGLFNADFMRDERFEVNTSAFPRPDLIVTNPPFSMWHKWVIRCCDLVSENGEVLAFGRTGTLEGVRGGIRASLWDERRWDLYPLAWRPSCTGSGNDSASYMVAIFGRDRTYTVKRLYRLPQDEP